MFSDVYAEPSALWFWFAAIVGGFTLLWLLLTTSALLMGRPADGFFVDLIGVAARAAILFALWWLGRSLMGEVGATGFFYWVGVVVAFFVGIAIALGLMGKTDQQDRSARRVLREFVGLAAAVVIVLLLTTGRIPLAHP